KRFKEEHHAFFIPRPPSNALTPIPQPRSTDASARPGHAATPCALPKLSPGAAGFRSRDEGNRDDVLAAYRERAGRPAPRPFGFAPARFGRAGGPCAVRSRAGPEGRR